jgi:glycosyltransferase involved in cell wall biosynthesis
MLQKIVPEVSVCITVYNHEKFLKECLDSVVCQLTNFKFEVIIGEDCSTDNTRQIVIEYAEKYPELIFPILYEQNQGTKQCPGKGNFTNTFYQCKGKYIVHIEGDDYLTDPNKLQIQFNYLNENPEASACFHNAMVVYDDLQLPAYEINKTDQKLKIFPEDLLYEKEVWFMATASVMFRRKLINERFPEWFLKCKSGDIPLYCMLSSQGYIGYIAKNMCVYRKHAGGLSMTDIHHNANFIENRIFMYESINNFTNKKYNSLIKPILANYYLNMANSIQYGNNAIYRLYFTLKSILISKPFSLFETVKFNAISKDNYDKYLNFRRAINNLLGKK